MTGSQLIMDIENLFCEWRKIRWNCIRIAWRFQLRSMRMVTRTTSLLTGDRSPMENRHRRRRVVSIRVQKAKGKVSAPLLGPSPQSIPFETFHRPAPSPASTASTPRVPAPTVAVPSASRTLFAQARCLCTPKKPRKMCLTPARISKKSRQMNPTPAQKQFSLNLSEARSVKKTISYQI